MTKPTLNNFNQLGEIIIQKYERYLPNAFDESLSILQKVNKIIEYLNKMGLLVDDLIKQWNEVMKWVMSDGLNEAVSDKLDKMVEDGTLTELINQVLFGEFERRLDSMDETLRTVRTYPALSIEGDKVVRFNLPYGHVDRYGADPFNGEDSYEAIQTAVDIVEQLGAGNFYDNNLIMTDVTFTDGGTYIIRSTIKIKYDKSKSNASRPITFTGSKLKMFYSDPYKGVTIKPLIPNHTGKNYANAFSINIVYDGDSNETDIATFGAGSGATIVNNIGFRGINISLNKQETLLYNINGIKMYRTRISVVNCNFEGLNEGIRQPNYDSSNGVNGTNYGDFSEFVNLNFRRMKRGAITLYQADLADIRNITNHEPMPSMQYLIKVTKGGGIRISGVHHAYHGEVSSTTGEFLPRNDGSGIDGTKAIIYLDQVEGVTITGLYVERQFLDYMIICENAKNISVKDSTERFWGNGYLALLGGCINIKLDDIYRHANVVLDYRDIYCKYNAVVNNIKIENFTRQDWFVEQQSLSDNGDWRNSRFTRTDSVFRNITSNLNEEQMNNRVDGENLSVIIAYETATDSWAIRDKTNTINLTTVLGQPVWDNDGLRLNSTLLYPYRINSITPCYVNATTMPYLPVSRLSVEKIYFIDSATGQRINTPNERMVALVNINTLINRKIYA